MDLHFPYLGFGPVRGGGFPEDGTVVLSVYRICNDFSVRNLLRSGTKVSALHLYIYSVCVCVLLCVCVPVFFFLVCVCVECSLSLPSGTAIVIPLTIQIIQDIRRLIVPDTCKTME